MTRTVERRQPSGIPDEDGYWYVRRIPQYEYVYDAKNRANNGWKPKLGKPSEIFIMKVKVSKNKSVHPDGEGRNSSDAKGEWVWDSYSANRNKIYKVAFEWFGPVNAVVPA